MLDFLIRNGTVIDGTGKASRQVDLAIAGDHIARIGRDLNPDEGCRMVDASGLVVAPGFIDMHSHSDLTLLTLGGAESALYQGVTTEVIGNCGFSCYPVHPERRNLLETYLAGIGYERADRLPWLDFDGYAANLEKKGVGVNAAPLVGHGSIRIAVMGFDSREASLQEKEEMARLLQIALDQGVFGMSSGLVYPPGINSPAGELEELCAIIAQAGGLYATHLRGDGLRAGPTLLESLDEALHTARVSGVSLQVSHVAAKFPNTGFADRVVERMEQARHEGIRIGCDMHPYMAAMTFLVSLMPPWFFEGGSDAAMQKLSDPAQRIKLRRALEETFGHLGWDEFWSKNQLVIDNPSSPFYGKRFDEISRVAGKDAAEVFLDILRDGGEDLFKAPVLMWIYSPEDTLRTFLWGHTMIGADGVSTSPQAGKELMSLHPRSWGAFPAVLRKFVREGRQVSLEEGLRKMTSLPASMVGLSDRGTLAEGMKADITIFDPERFIDRSTYENARQYAEGMEWVFVNGVPAIEEGNLTGRKTGRVLRRK